MSATPGSSSDRPNRSQIVTALLWLLLGIAIVAAGVSLRRTQQAARGEQLVAPASLAPVTVRDASGGEVALTHPGGGVVVVVSTTCAHCHNLLRALNLSGSVDFSRLTVAAVQGVEPGQQMLRELGLPSDIRVVAPLGTDQVSVMNFVSNVGLNGTPALFDVAADGSVLAHEEGFNQSNLNDWVTRLQAPR